MFKITLAMLFCLFLSGCYDNSNYGSSPPKCSCKNIDCGIQCRDRCEGDMCLPGKKCCNKCTCPRSIMRAIMDIFG